MCASSIMKGDPLKRVQYEARRRHESKRSQPSLPSRKLQSRQDEGGNPHDSGNGGDGLVAAFFVRKRFSFPPFLSGTQFPRLECHTQKKSEKGGLREAARN